MINNSNDIRVEVWTMKSCSYIVLCLLVQCVVGFKYDNITLEPALRQLYDFKRENPVNKLLLTNFKNLVILGRRSFHLVLIYSTEQFKQ